MEPRFWAALLASTLAACVTSLGIYAIRRFAGWGQRNTTYFMCFAAGVLISASFLHIIPESFAMSAHAPAWMLVGFFGLHGFNRAVTSLAHQKDPSRDYSLGVVPMIGIGMHSFIDGIIYSITFTASIFTGSLAALGMVLHEFPEGIITYLLLVKARFSERRAMILAFVSAAATTPLGMLASYPFLEGLRGEALGTLLAASAGGLMYVGATHLLPRAEEEHRKYSLAALAGGILVAVVVVLSNAH
ncbi:MAG TPA: ZIP family metal transporter [Sandaracinaceae bacterium]